MALDGSSFRTVLRVHPLGQFPQFTVGLSPADDSPGLFRRPVRSTRAALLTCSVPPGCLMCLQVTVQAYGLYLGYGPARSGAVLYGPSCDARYPNGFAVFILTDP